MEEIRIEKLLLGSDYMSDELLNKIDLFKQFIENTCANICILCSDKRLKIKIDKLFVDYTNINITVHGTYEENIEPIIETARYADAIIVNTLALKIAPKGLFDILKAIAPLKKNCYFILSGWESLPKDITLAKNKIKQTDIEFEFASIVSCKNAYDKPIEGFKTTKDILSVYIQNIYDSYSNFHKQQIEILYQSILWDVKKFKTKLCSEIIQDIGCIKQMQDILWKKEKKYSVTFSHSSVRILEIVEKINKSISSINSNDILSRIYNGSDYSPEQIFVQEQESFEKQAKNIIIDLIQNEIQNLINSSESLLYSQNSMKTTECINDLISFTAQLHTCRFIKKSEIQEITECIQNSEILNRTGSISQDGLKTVFQQLNKQFPVKIMTFNFSYNEKKTFKMVAHTLESIQEEFKRQRRFEDFELTTEEQSNTSMNILKNMKEKSILTENSSKWKIFQNEVNRLVEFAKNVLSELLYNNIKLLNDEIETQSYESVREYFSSINAKLDTIEKNMKNNLHKYED